MKTYVVLNPYKNEKNAYNKPNKGIQKKLELISIIKNGNIFCDTRKIKITKMKK